jgi:hypothetical protein
LRKGAPEGVHCGLLFQFLIEAGQLIEQGVKEGYEVLLEVREDQGEFAKIEKV